MPGPKRNRRERTDEWAQIQQWTLWPEQVLYEQIRPLVLFHETAGEQAKEIDVPRRTLARKACFLPGSKVEREKLARPSRQRSTNSLWTCTRNSPR